MNINWVQILIVALAISFSCSTRKSHKTSNEEVLPKDEHYFTGKAEIDTSCVKHILSLIKDSLSFKPSYHDCVSTNKFKKAIIFGIKAQPGEFIFGGPGAFVAINDTCGIDTIISSSKKKNKSK